MPSDIKTACLDELWKRLQQAEQKLQFTLEGTSAVLWTAYVKPRTIHFHTDVFFGHSVSKLASFDDWFAYVHPSDRPIVKKASERLTKGANNVTYNFRFKQGSDQYKWLQTKEIEYERDTNGKLLSFIGITYDFDHQMKIYEMTFEQANIGIAHVALDGTWIHVNQRICDILGYDKDELLKLSFQDITFEDDLNSDLSNVQRLIENKADRYELEKRYIRKDGSIIWANLAVAIVRDENGAGQYFISTITDTTKAKQDAQRLQKNEQILNESERISQIGSWEYIPATDTHYWTKGVYQIYGRDQSLPPANIQEVEQYFEPNSWNRLMENINHAIHSGAPYECDVQIIRPDGGRRWITARGEALVDGNGEQIGLRGTVQDITDKYENDKKIKHLALHDALTDLPNRTLLFLRLEHAIEIARRAKKVIAICFIDIDNFKNINDTFGHVVGDAIILQVAERLKANFFTGDTIARIGGDEFVIILENMATLEDIRLGLEKLLVIAAEPYEIEERVHHLTVSAGVSLYPNDHVDPNELIRFADAAMYRSKEEGKNKFTFFQHEITQKMFNDMQIETNLRHAIRHNQIDLFYQPQINLSTGKLIGFEALARWHSPVLGNVLPDRFIPIAESSRLIIPLGEDIFNKACIQHAQWSKSHGFAGTIAVNVSGVQLNQPNFIRQVTNILSSAGVAGRSIEIEITESVLMQDPDHWLEILGQLKRMGFTITVDDFGTGYSSLAYLHMFPIDKLKIDISFVKNLPNEQDASQITKMILALAKSMSIKTVAEGVETKAQYDYLKSNQCDEAQGNWFGSPQTAQHSLCYLNDFRIDQE